MNKLIQYLKSYGFSNMKTENLRDLYEQVLSKNNNKGTICKATGTGKSWDVIFAICYVIYNNANNNKKVLIDIAAHLLDLNKQLFKDLIEVVFSDVFTDPKSKLYNKKLVSILKNDYIILVNSSSEVNSYNNNENFQNITGVNALPFGTTNINDINKKLIFVVSCYKSVQTVMSSCVNLSNDFVIAALWDESHEVTMTPNDDNGGVTISRDMLTEFIERSDYFLSFSATPRKQFVDLINEITQKKDAITSPFLVYLSPADAIRKGYIVKPRVFIASTDNSELNVEHIIKSFEAYESSGYVMTQKMLVMAPESYYKLSDDERVKKISAIFDDLCKDKRLKGVDIYMTSSETKKRCSKNKNKIYTTDEFLNDINNSTNKLIVLNIEQLTTGIDIKSLNHVIEYYGKARDNISEKRTRQVWGRVLRCADDEYAVLPKKLKPYGIVTIVVNKNNYTELKADITEFVNKTYETDDVYMLDRWSSHKKSKQLHIGSGVKKEKCTEFVRTSLYDEINTDMYNRRFSYSYIYDTVDEWINDTFKDNDFQLTLKKYVDRLLSEQTYFVQSPQQIKDMVMNYCITIMTNILSEKNEKLGSVLF